MEVSSKISGVSRKNFEEYTNLEDIVADVEALSQDNFIQSQAIEVFERYLRKRSPNMLIGLDKTLEHSGVRDSIMTRASDTLSASRASLSHMSRTSSPGLTSRSALHSSVLGAQRISAAYRLDIVDREIEDGKMMMEKLRKHFNSTHFLLQVEEDSLKIELQVINDCKSQLEVFFAENTDKKTGRLFHEKFLRFLETELNFNDRELRKLKLKTKTQQTEYSRLKSQQQQKIELRERLHPVDQEKLLIENQELLEVLEQKTRQLLDHKKVVGKRGQNLVLTKSKLNDTTMSLKSVTQDIRDKEAKYHYTETKENQNLNDLMAAEVLNKCIKKFNTTFKSPDVHSYLMMEVRLDEMRKMKESWARRCRYQKQTMMLLEHQAKQLAPPSRTKSVKSLRSIRSMRSMFSCASADSPLKARRETAVFPHCTPTSPMKL